MTENLAGRGEGLAGAIELLRDQYQAMLDGKFDGATYIGQVAGIGREAEIVIKLVIAELTAALEAAAPAGTVQTLHRINSIPSKLLNLGRELRERQRNQDGIYHPIAAEAFGVCADAIESALATPSPQAPGPNCNKLRHGMGYSYCPGCPPEEVPAATQEQPAGSGASRSVQRRIALQKGYSMPEYMYEAQRIEGGSPRNVGEDGALREALADAFLANRDNTMNAIDDYEGSGTKDSLYALIDAVFMPALSLSSPIEPPLDRSIEWNIRSWLWDTHGHTMLYGDDGEMQCKECPLDYKRAPLIECFERANTELGLVRVKASRAQASSRDDKPPEGIQHPDWGYDCHGNWVRKAQASSEIRGKMMASFDKVIPSVETRVQIVSCILGALAPSASSEVREALRVAHLYILRNDRWSEPVLCRACLKSAMLAKDIQHVEDCLYVRIEALLAPSRQGAGGK